MRGVSLHRLSLAVAVAIGAFLALGPSLAFAQEQLLEVRFLDVGQGDAVLIQVPDGRAVLYDGGPSPTRALEYLQEFGVGSVELVVVSHPHQDHIGGLIEVISHYQPRYVLDSGLAHTTQTYEAYLRAIQAAGSELLSPEPRAISLGFVILEVVPPPGIESWGLNDNSVGLLVRYGDFRMMLGGDAEAAQWSWWLDQGLVPEGPVEVHKASHHGSRNGDTAAGISRLAPQVVVIGTSATNSYGHPHPEALQVYDQVGARVYRTDFHGTVGISAGRDGGFTVAVGQDRVAFTTPVGVPERAPMDAAPAADCVDINSAPAPQLERIIHIGPVRARDVMRLRQERPFSSVAELTRVSGIASARMADIRSQGLACVGGATEEVTPPPPSQRAPPPPPTRTQRCCRVCTTGKACGNSCINRNHTCRQPPGCACNGDEITFLDLVNQRAGLQQAPFRTCAVL